MARDAEDLYVIKGPKTIYEMTSAEVGALLERTKTVLIPVGATEDHGAHLPLGTDMFEAREICRRAAASLTALGCPVLIGPTIPFGVSTFHMGFPGTITLTSSTLILLLKEVMLSLYQHGFRNLILVHGHDGNLPQMMVAAQDVVNETPDATVAVMNWMVELAKAYAKGGLIKSTKGESHGGEGETARIIATHPELVDLSQAQEFYLQPHELRKIQSPEHMKTGGGIFYPTRSYKALTPVGSIGNPALATEETGEKGYAVIVDWLVSIIKRDFFDEAQ
ncbi:MAG: creatininase family protein [Chloroflexaceae bacterium]|jgi:creatinine amidohydrolase|nr:creatininase family protein [Chloroflexaceae bacterium]